MAESELRKQARALKAGGKAKDPIAVAESLHAFALLLLRQDRQALSRYRAAGKDVLAEAERLCKR